MVAWLKNTWGQIIVALSGLGILAGPELESLSLEGTFARTDNLRNLAIFLMLPWVRPLLWLLLLIFGVRWLKQWIDRRYVHRTAIDLYLAEQIAAADARIETRAQGLEAKIEKQRLPIEAVAMLSYINRHRPAITETMKNYDRQWSDIEAFISDERRMTEPPNTTAVSWAEYVRWLKKTRLQLEIRAKKAFHFGAVSLDDAISRREPPEARNVQNEEVRRAYRELWRDDLLHREWVRLFNESLDARVRDANNTIETSVTNAPPNQWLGLEGGPPEAYIPSVPPRD